VQASSDFVRDGYLEPVRLLTPGECKEIVRYLRRTDIPAPSVWEKARAVHERALFELATRPAVLDPVRAVLGPDVVLWGVSALSRAPGQAHPWHSDIESCGPEGGFVSVWIGLANTSRHSSLQVIAGSHRLGRSVQEARATKRITRDDARPDVLLELAREHDEAVALVEPDMSDGEAIFFDGRLWHGTANWQRNGNASRSFSSSPRPSGRCAFPAGTPSTGRSASSRSRSHR
jgi:ectoine hydroxylase-related dioxygenase (phytanoyl-CoA dioxygenase family)